MALSGLSGAPNVFSPTGFKAQAAQYGTGGDNPLAPIARYAQGANFGGIEQAAGYGNGLESQREGLLNNIMGLSSIGGIQGAAARSANQIGQTAQQQGNAAATALQGMGYGSGIAGGALAQSYGRGASEINASNQHYTDPNYVSSALQNAYGATMQGMQNPLLNEAAAYEPIITGQNATNYAQRGQGLIGQLAPIIGQIAGGPIGSSLMRGGLSGGGSTTSSAWPYQGAGDGSTFMLPSQNTPGPWSGGYVPYG